MSDDVVQDIELADVWDATAHLDRFQVARRLRLLQVQVGFLAGVNTPHWRELPPVERHRLSHFAGRIVSYIRQREPDNPAVFARRVHEARTGSRWDDLSPDEQQIAIDLMDLILDWAEREGPR